MFLGAIADDLTGATDLALALSSAGLRVIQVVGVPDEGSDFHGADAVVIALKSRTSPPAEAVAQSLESARCLLSAGARKLFFKYCSTFDSTDEGNIGPVTDALLDFLGESGTIACPAFPANGRTVYKGHLFVGDFLLSDSSMKNHPLTPMRDANLVRVLQRQTKRPVSLIPNEVVSQGEASLAGAFSNLNGIAIVDAISDEDLNIIGRAARRLKLVTGASGVAKGLSANFIQGQGRRQVYSIAHSPGKAVILAGSCSATTLRQIQFAEAVGIPSMRIDVMALAAGHAAVEKAVEFLLRSSEDGPAMLYSSSPVEEVLGVQGKLGRFQAGELVEGFFGSVANRLRELGVTRFLVAGGETSGAVIEALKVKVMNIGPEIDPGVPWMFSMAGKDVLAFALKSGNFGSDDFFIKAWDILR